MIGINVSKTNTKNIFGFINLSKITNTIKMSTHWLSKVF